MTPTILEIALVLLVNHHNPDLIKNFEIPLLASEFIIISNRFFSKIEL